jgi:hypothetical protein
LSRTKSCTSNKNNAKALQRAIKKPFEILRQIQLVPSVATQEILFDAIDDVEKIKKDFANLDQQLPQLEKDQRIFPDNDSMTIKS